MVAGARIYSERDPKSLASRDAPGHRLSGDLNRPLWRLEKRDLDHYRFLYTGGDPHIVFPHVSSQYSPRTCQFSNHRNVYREVCTSVVLEFYAGHRTVTDLDFMGTEPEMW